VWDGCGGGVCGAEAEPGEGQGGVAGGLGDAVGWGETVVVGCGPCAARGGGRWGV
jgi:hypothetical protein